MIQQTVSYEALEKSDWTINALLSYAHQSVNGKELTELVDINTSKINQKTDIQEEKQYQYLGLQEVSAEKGLIVDAESVFGKKLSKRAKLQVQTGDILVSLIRPERKKIAIVDDAFSGSLVNNSFAVLRPKQAGSSAFLYFLLHHPNVQERLQLLARGSAVPTIPLNELKQLQLPIANVPEEKVREANEWYHAWRDKQYHKKTIQQIVEETFINQEHEKKELSEYASFRSGVAVPTKQYQEEGAVYIRISDFSEGFLDDSEMVYVPSSIKTEHPKAMVQENDVLISRVGTIGKVVRITREFEHAIASQHITIIETNREVLLPEYLHYYLQTSEAVTTLKNKASGSGQKFVKLKDIREIEFPLLPLEKQQEMIERIEREIEINSDKSLREDIHTFINSLKK